MFLFAIINNPVRDGRGGMSLTLSDDCASSIKHRMSVTSKDFYSSLLKRRSTK